MKAKRSKIILLFMAACTISIHSAFANNPEKEYDNKESNSFHVMHNSVLLSNNDYHLKIINLQIDPLGIIFFGPQVALDFQFANLIAVGPFMRWHYAGLFYQGIVTDWFSGKTTTSFASYSFGAETKFLIPIGSGQHRPYVGLALERSIGSDSWDPGGSWGERIYEYKTNVFSINLGYRLLTHSAFNLSAGMGVAISQDIESIGYYEFGEDEIDHYKLETRILPMIQLVLGWQIGGK